MPPPSKPTEFKPEEDFAKLIAEWRKKHQLREDDPLLLCLELFQLHQTHWDAIRRQELPSFADFGESLKKLHQDAAAIQRQAGVLTEELRHYKSSTRLVAPSVTGLILTAISAAFAGWLAGKFLH
jgi:hypothetical protein